jgi:DNA-binding NarL/FixJ family response regulator
MITKRHPDVKVIMLSSGSDPGLTEAATERGAWGIISEDCHIGDIVRILLRVRQGERVFEDALAGAVVRAFRLPGADNGDWLRVLLTSREQEVLMRMVDGEPTRQIACSLAITEATVRTHVRNVLAKLGVHSRLEASTVVAESGVLGRYLPGMQAQHAAGLR